MEDAVEVGAVHRRPAPEEALGKVGAVIVKGLAVGGKRNRLLFPAFECQGAENHIQIGKVHIQFVPGGKQNLLPDGG